MKIPSKTSHCASTMELSCNGLTFPTLTWGPETGRPILLLHGFPQEPRTWTPVAQALASVGFRVFAPYQRGYANSTRPAEPCVDTFATFVDDVAGIIERLQFPTIDIVGFGMGGAQAWMFAATRAAQVRSLTSLRFPHPAAFAYGIQFDPEQRRKWEHIRSQLEVSDLATSARAMLANEAATLRRLLSTSGLPQPFLNRYVTRLEEPGALVGALAWERAVRTDEFSQVPPVTVPTLFMWSEGPALARTSVDATRDYVRAPYAEVLIPHAGNFMLETSPAALLSPLRAHLQAT